MRRRESDRSRIAIEHAATWRADAALLLCTAIWGFTFPAIQIGLKDMGPFAFTAARFGLASVVMLIAFRRRAFRLSTAGYGWAAALGVCVAVGNTLQTVGLQYTSPTNSAFVTALYVVIVPVLTVVIERVRPRLSSVVAVVIAAAGLYLITNPSGIGRMNLGDLLTIGAALAFAVHIVIADIVTPRHDPVALSTWQIVTVAVLGTILMVPAGDTKLVLTPWVIMTILVTGVLATALAFSIQLWAQRESSATHVTVIFMMEPVWSAVFTRLIMGQSLTPLAMFGGGLILLAILVSQIGAHRRE